MEFTNNNLLLAVIGLLTVLNLGATGFYLLVLRKDVQAIRNRLDDLEQTKSVQEKNKDPFLAMLERMGETDPEKERKAEAVKDAYLEVLRSEPLASFLTQESRASANKAAIRFDGQALFAVTGCEAPGDDTLKTYSAPLMVCLALMEAGRMPLAGDPTWKACCDFLDQHTPMRLNMAVVQASLATNKELHRVSHWRDEDKDDRHLNLKTVLSDYPETDVQHGGDDIRTLHSLVQILVRQGKVQAGHPLVAVCEKHMADLARREAFKAASL